MLRVKSGKYDYRDLNDYTDHPGVIIVCNTT